MSIWPKYEQRFYHVSKELALDWPKRLQIHGMIIDDTKKWARIANEFTDYYWASVIRDRGKVHIGIEDTETFPNHCLVYNLKPGLYLQIVFRVNTASRYLADDVVRKLFDEDSQCAGRSIWRLGCKPQLVES